MTFRLVFRPEAEAELLEARGWHDEQLAGLGNAFAADLASVVTRIVQNPLASSRVYGETRRTLLRRFPYAVYFRVLADEVVVLAVMHGHRYPRRWQSRR